MNRKLLIFALLLITIFIGFKYRFRSYSFFPPVAETFDEQVVAWVGSSLINTGIPTGWSFIEDYYSDNKDHLVKQDGWSLSYDNIKPNLSNLFSFPKPLSHKVELTLDGYTSQFTMVQPQIEQPPLGSLISSFLSGSYKKHGLEDVKLKDIRLPPVILSSLSIGLVFIVAYLSFGATVALLSSLIYALVPTIVLTSRLALSENYLNFFFLIGVIFAQLWIIKGRTIYFYLSCFLIIVCYLIKPFGITLGLVLFLAAFVFNKPRIYLILPIVSSLVAISIFYLYGSFYDPQLFKKILLYQTNRLTSPLHGILKILLPKITKIFLDGWIIFGWLSAAILTFKNKVQSDFWILCPIISFTFMYMLYGGEDYGWYRLPIYPFLAIAISEVLVREIKKPGVWVGILFLMTVFATSLWWGTFGVNWQPLTFIFRLLIALIFILLILGLNPKFKMITSLTLILLIVLSLWLNIQTINNAQKFWHTLGDLTSVMPFHQ